MDDAVIRTCGLTHCFKAVKAVDGVDLAVAPGEIFGFLGRNGAGKTTVIRALLGLLTPTAGDVSLFGTPVRAGRTPSARWGQVGYLVEGPGLYPSLTVRDHLVMAARYRGLPLSAVQDVVERLDLGRYRDVRARTLSLGNGQRLGLAMALLHRPPLLVLDEPVNGLDPAGVVEVRHLLRDLAGEGVTVFMSTHLIGEVAKLADRVGIIHAGRLVAELSGARLAVTGERLVSTFRTPELACLAASALRTRGIETRVSRTSLETTAVEALRRPDRVAEHLVVAGAAPMSLTVEHEDLEDLFLRLTEEAAA